MTVKFVIQEWIANGNGQFFSYGDFQDIDTNTYLSSYFPLINAYDYDTSAQIRNAAYTAIVTQAGVLGYSTFTSTDIFDLTLQVQVDWNQSSSTAIDYIKNKPSIPSTVRTTSSLSLSLVGTGATGTQIDASKDSTVRVTVSTSTTSTIGGPATSIVTLKTCATNSSTEGDWTSAGIFESDQAITLAIALQSVQTVKGQITSDVPAGYYVKLVNSGTGTHSEAYVSGQKTIYG